MINDIRHHTSSVTKQKRGSVLHTLLHNFYVRVAWMCIALIALMVVTIGTYEGTESLIYLLFHNNIILGPMIW